MDDATLIRGTLDGRLEDFGLLVERYQRALHAFVARQTADPAVADEVVQRSFLRAYHALPVFRFETTFKGWLHEIALGECRTGRRRGARRAGERPGSGDDSPTVDPLPPTALGREIGKLSRRERVVLALRAFSDLSFREIARIEGISITRAKVRYHRAVNRLGPWLR